MGKGYYVGLDMGTGSVGWAVTDESYQIFRRHGRLRKSGECSEQEGEDWTDGDGGLRFCRRFLQKRSAGLILDFF